MLRLQFGEGAEEPGKPPAAPVLLHFMAVFTVLSVPAAATEND